MHCHAVQDCAQEWQPTDSSSPSDSGYQIAAVDRQLGQAVLVEDDAPNFRGLVQLLILWLKRGQNAAHLPKHF